MTTGCIPWVWHTDLIGVHFTLSVLIAASAPSYSVGKDVCFLQAKTSSIHCPACLLIGRQEFDQTFARKLKKQIPQEFNALEATLKILP